MIVKAAEDDDIMDDMDEEKESKSKSDKTKNDPKQKKLQLHKFKQQQTKVGSLDPKGFFSVLLLRFFLFLESFDLKIPFIICQITNNKIRNKSISLILV